LIPVAVSLAAGALVGARLDGLARASPTGTSVELLLAALGVTLVAALALRVAGRRLPDGAAPLGACVLAGLACVRAARERALEPPRDVLAPVAVPGQEPGEPPWTGVWRARGSAAAAGRLEPASARTSAPPVLVETEVAPRDGERIALLAGATATPWAAGPVPGPLGREGRYRASLELPLDLLVRRAPPARPSLSARATAAIERVRVTLAERLARFERRAGLDGLGAALLLGRRDALEHERVDRFTRTGTRHLLAVSGLHVGLLFGLGAGLLARATRTWARASVGGALAGATLLGSYAVLAGAAAPVSRAALMLGFALAAPTSLGGRRRADGWSLLAAAFALEVVLDPLAPIRPGASLSYLATLGLMAAPRAGARAFGAHAEAWTNPGGGALAHVARLVARAASALARRGIVASTAATLATLPIVWTTFGEVAPLGVLLTPLCVPLLAVLLCALLAGLLLPSLAPAGIAGATAAALEGLLALGDRLPGTPTALPLRPFWLVALASWGALLVWRRAAGARAALRADRASAPPRTALTRGIALAGAGVLLPWAPTPAGLSIVLLDVGHGTACAVRAPGLPALVVDAGSRDRPRVASEALGPLLAAWDPGSLAIVVTHDDLDHAACIPWLRSRRPTDWEVCAVSARPDERQPHGSGAVVPGAGAVLLRDSRTLRVRIVRGRVDPGNEGSLGVELSTPRTRAVLLGDAEGPGLAAMLRDGLAPGPVDLLLAPHHGSDTPWLGGLLEHLQPELVWISAAGTPPIARELDRRGVRWRSTGVPPGSSGAADGLERPESERGLLFGERPGGSFPSSGGPVRQNRSSSRRRSKSRSHSLGPVLEPPSPPPPQHPSREPA